HKSLMGAIQRIGQAQQRSQLVHALFIRVREDAVGRMLDGRQGFAVVARQVRDDGLLFPRQLCERLHHDHLQGVPMVAARTDVVADVVQDGGVFEQLAVFARQAVQRFQFHEKRPGQALDLMRVSRVVVVAAGEFEDGVEFRVHAYSYDAKRSYKTPQRRPRVLTSSAVAPIWARAWESRMAPPRMMSARAGSRPGICLRSATVREAKRSMRFSSASARSVWPCSDSGSVRPCRSMAARLVIVPPTPTTCVSPL